MAIFIACKKSSFMSTEGKLLNDRKMATQVSSLLPLSLFTFVTVLTNAGSNCRIEARSAGILAVKRSESAKEDEEPLLLNACDVDTHDDNIMINNLFADDSNILVILFILYRC